MFDPSGTLRNLPFFDIDKDRFVVRHTANDNNAEAPFFHYGWDNKKRGYIITPGFITKWNDANKRPEAYADLCKWYLDTSPEAKDSFYYWGDQAIPINLQIFVLPLYRKGDTASILTRTEDLDELLKEGEIKKEIPLVDATTTPPNEKIQQDLPIYIGAPEQPAPEIIFLPWGKNEARQVGNAEFSIEKVDKSTKYANFAVGKRSIKKLSITEKRPQLSDGKRGDFQYLFDTGDLFLIYLHRSNVKVPACDFDADTFARNRGKLQ